MDPSKALPHSAETPKPKRRWFRVLSNLIILVAIAAIGVFVTSNENQKRIRLNVINNTLVVEEGKFFPIGFQPMEIDTDSKTKAYTPIPLRKTMEVSVPIEFDDRTELDQYLFSLLSAWSKELIESGSSSDITLAENLINRSEWLPGVSVQQRREIRAMQADLAFSAAKRQIMEAKEGLEAAAESLKDATRVESRFEVDARQWQDWANYVLEMFNTAPQLEGRPPQPTKPLEAP